MDIQVVHHQMNGLGFRILNGQLECHLGEFKPRTVRRGKGEVPTCFGLYCAEDIGRAAALILVITPSFTPRHGRRGRADVGVQGDWFLIQAHDRLLGIVGLFIRLQNILHLGDVVFIEFGHAPHSFPATA